MSNLDVAAIITDQNVKEALGHRFPSVPCLAIPPGESSKSLKSFEKVHSWLIKNGIQRGNTIGVIGGGVVGDLGGFVAATYMRGITYIQVPTSLLAMVDSSVGGKVGVDLPEGKNLVGAFHPPIEVRVCLSALDTLPIRHFTNGMAEVLKYGFISDPAILDVDPDDELSSLVRQCIQIKADIVAADEFETNGIRATLNFGHTIGHALETA
ncbi:MAG: 3-dehydroquinate synthase family protein, partial [Fimbriimonadaceae bacterium]